MNNNIPGLGQFMVITGIEDHLPPYSASATPEQSVDVIVLLMRQGKRSVQERRWLRDVQGENHSRYDLGFVLSESQARELADSLLSRADELAKKRSESTPV